MADQQDRDRESAQTEETKFEREVDDEARRRHEAAERLKRDFGSEPAPDEPQE